MESELEPLAAASVTPVRAISHVCTEQQPVLPKPRTKARGTHSSPSRLHRGQASPTPEPPHATLAEWQLLHARLRSSPRSEEHSRPSRRQRVHGRWSVHAVLEARQWTHACRRLRLVCTREGEHSGAISGIVAGWHGPAGPTASCWGSVFNMAKHTSAPPPSLCALYSSCDSLSSSNCQDCGTVNKLDGVSETALGRPAMTGDSRPENIRDGRRDGA